MAEPLDKIRLYNDLAWLWPLWGDHETEYAHYAAHVARLIATHAAPPATSLLSLACGGGKNLFTLKKHFSVTGLDLSPVMLRQAAALNPECAFVQADMRTFSLDILFDAIFLEDGVSHLICRTDLAATFARAYRHLRPGGVLVVTPDITTESFRQNQTTCAEAVARLKPPGVDVSFVENLYDPDPTDEHYEATILYLIRERGRLRIETDRWTLGLFPLAAWKQLLSVAGFVVHEHAYAQDDVQYPSLACVKSGA
ncbi:class I SAM-dependent methyltransferase [Geoalkalibacter halelectricus]|uniref:Class I SAM-dependent methyltransferase n=1 Tax=Geoalkalibacter halelectricus TaxID=2847045 RepID=A0ABY5ZKY0_9BACT|nr:class I SAM-dependent methyltransferase [Geoalkalibacter halelectricus]MDO3376633.1 class I SAM-dependent methyltransferase [Geoalkalibacter halelectricus]UWZ78409.1 class I SAM-dependent methyltransferase [Geoalkalibacter halelectricus]